MGAVGTINGPVVVVNHVSNATAVEGTNLVHTVTLSGTTAHAVTYAFSLADGTATAPGDYTNAPVFSNGVTLAAGVLTVPAGVSSFTVTYPTLDRCCPGQQRDHGADGGRCGRDWHHQRPGGAGGQHGEQRDGQ